MTQAEKLNLLSGTPIQVGAFHIRQIKLRELGDSGICSFEQYQRSLSVISLGREELLKILQLESEVGQLSGQNQQSMTVFRLLTGVASLRQCFFEALSFFISEPFRYVEEENVFQVIDSSSAVLGVISNNTYPQIRRTIMQANCLAVEDVELQGFKGKRARAIYERIMAGRAASQKQKAADERSLSLSSIISAVAARHHSLNILNIWDLTVYQLYDQFAQLNKSLQVDVSSMRWAAWGQEPFDFSLWYKDMK